MADIIEPIGGSPHIEKRLKDMGDGTYADVVFVGGGTIASTGDIEIGAIEIKNDTDDTRAKVGSGTAANGLRVTVATDDALHAKIGEVQASPTANTVLDRLKALLTGTILAAGSALIGKVGIDQTTPGTTNAVAPIAGQSGVSAGAGIVDGTTQRVVLASDGPTVTVLGTTAGAKVITDANGSVQQYLRGLVSQWIAGTLTFASQAYAAAVSLTRTNDTNAYAANDVVGAATGSTAALTFAIAPAAGGQVVITSVALEADVAAVISGEVGYRLHLYNVTPPSALGDNVAWDLPAGDRASYLGYIDLGQPVDLGSTLYIETNGINKQITASGGNVFGYLVTLGAFTPSASSVRVVTMHSAAL